MPKVCKECGQEYHLSNFRQHRNYSDGREDRCKGCAVKKHYVPNEISKLLATWLPAIDTDPPDA